MRPETLAPLLPAYCGAAAAIALKRWLQIDVTAYQAFLLPRLEQMRLLLKPTGTLYVHLDWHVVHYVKVMLDELFGYACRIRFGTKGCREHKRGHGGYGG